MRHPHPPARPPPQAKRRARRAPRKAAAAKPAPQIIKKCAYELKREVPPRSHLRAHGTSNFCSPVLFPGGPGGLAPRSPHRPDCPQSVPPPTRRRPTSGAARPWRRRSAWASWCPRSGPPSAPRPSRAAARCTRRARRSCRRATRRACAWRSRRCAPPPLPCPSPCLLPCTPRSCRPASPLPRACALSSRPFHRQTPRAPSPTLAQTAVPESTWFM